MRPVLLSDTVHTDSSIPCLNTMYKWYSSCLLVPTDKHLDDYVLMEGAQRGARVGCSGTMDNLLVDRMVTQDCHRKKRKKPMILSVMAG